MAPAKSSNFASSKTKPTSAEAQEMLWRSLKNGATADWWYLGGSLYQVAIQPFGHGSGTVIVGREIDYRAVHDMGRISAGQVAFSYGPSIVASTFRPIEEQEANKKLRIASVAQASRDRRRTILCRFHAAEYRRRARSLSLTVLKSYSEATAFLTA